MTPCGILNHCLLPQLVPHARSTTGEQGVPQGGGA